jgi:hypothetical protein
MRRSFLVVMMDYGKITKRLHHKQPNTLLFSSPPLTPSLPPWQIYSNGFNHLVRWVIFAGIVVVVAVD